MASVLLSMLARGGVASHLPGLAQRLRGAGHRVTVVTSEGGAEPYRAAGFSVHLIPEAPWPQLPRTLPPLLRRARQLYIRVQRSVIEPLPQQWAVVRRVLSEAEVDVVVTDPLLLGASMLAAAPRESRPAVLMLGLSAPWMPDPLVAPYGMGIAPLDERGGRVRTAAYELIASRAMKHLSHSFNRAVEQTFGVRLQEDLRTSPARADVWAQLTVPRFEYPRASLPPNFRFVGPLPPPALEPAPEWWDPVREPPVIAVRADGADALEDLVRPVIAAYGGTESTIIVAGVGRGAAEAAHGGRLPANVHFEDGLPWSRLIPTRSVVVATGDYVHTQHALRRGIPLVLAGTLETDVETAARVAWAGAGVDLRTARPTP